MRGETGDLGKPFGSFRDELWGALQKAACRERGVLVGINGARVSLDAGEACIVLGKDIFGWPKTQSRRYVTEYCQIAFG